MAQSYDFKGSNVETATRNGLTELGLNAEDVEVEVISRGGIFSKAVVRITPKEKEITEEEVKEEPTETAEEKIEETVEKEPSTTEEKKFDMDLYVEKQESGSAFLAGLLKLTGKKVGFESKIKAREEELCFYINGEDAASCIGYKGETLESIQILVSHFINDGEDDHVNVIVDADFYREKRKKILIALAKRTATQAYDQHREIALEPMNSFERRIIHQTLQNSYEAETRSEGEGRDRHVVIVPKNGTMSYGTNSSFKRNGPSRIKTYGEKRKFF